MTLYAQHVSAHQASRVYTQDPGNMVHARLVIVVNYSLTQQGSQILLRRRGLGAGSCSSSSLPSSFPSSSALHDRFFTTGKLLD